MVRETANDRTVFRIGGKDRVDFLQGLVTNDVNGLSDGLVYAALLSPQGKYLADFFLVPDNDAILLDVQSGLAESLIKRLALYRLRADVQIEETGISVLRGLGDGPDGSFRDPRHSELGWRFYCATRAEADPETDGVDWNALRVAHGIPETAIELVPDETYILEAGFERLNGVDFKKGCYVGQEIVARMKHKTELRKGLARVVVEGSAPVGTPILAGGKPAGKLFTQSEGHGLAHLRFDRTQNAMLAGEAEVRLLG
jgi:folate-binding protein YgfZ